MRIDKETRQIMLNILTETVNDVERDIIERLKDQNLARNLILAELDVLEKVREGLNARFIYRNPGNRTDS